MNWETGTEVPPDDHLHEPGARRILATSAVFLLPILCCVGPSLIAAGALGVLGSWLAKPGLIGAAAAVALTVLVWRLCRRGRRTGRRRLLPPRLAAGRLRPGSP